jgi:hypothetical protein
MSAKTAEYWKDLARVFVRIVRVERPISLYLSASGHPTWIPGVGCSLVGTYTQKATLEQIIEDIHAADLERRRKAH